MGAAVFTIYQLDTNLSFEESIDIYNNRDENKEQYREKSKNEDLELKNIDDYSVYLLTSETKPAWRIPISYLVKDLPEIRNISNSYILFLKVGDNKFAATGGTAHHVINNYKVFNFGVKLLTRLIDIDSPSIKRIDNRPVAGNIQSSIINYVGGIPIFSERDFNTFIRGAHLSLDSSIIQDKLGIPINTRKKDFSFLAKDSIRLGKSITIRQLDNMLGKISSLLEQYSISINYFERINKENPETNKLNKKMTKKLVRYIKDDRSVNLYINLFSRSFERITLNIGGENYQIESTTDIKDSLQKFFTRFTYSEEVTETLINSTMRFKYEDGSTSSTNFTNLIDTTVNIKNQAYWLLEGNWFRLETNFIEQLNKAYKDKMGNFYDCNFKLSEINHWPDSITREEDFNFTHNNIDSVYVLDQIFYQYIELCDLMIVHKDENKIYFVHVKKGLKNNMRELASQIENAVRVFSESHDLDYVLSNYYQSIVQKIIDVPNESTMSRAARKFKNDFPNKPKFIELVKNSKIEFVCAIKPEKSHNIMDPSTFGSNIAKISLMKIIDLSKQFVSPIKILKIKQ